MICEFMLNRLDIFGQINPPPQKKTFSKLLNHYQLKMQHSAWISDGI